MDLPLLDPGLLVLLVGLFSIFTPPVLLVAKVERMIEERETRLQRLRDPAPEAEVDDADGGVDGGEEQDDATGAELKREESARYDRYLGWALADLTPDQRRLYGALIMGGAMMVPTGGFMMVMG